MENVFIKDSVIQGRGAFAARSFYPGEEILEIDDSRIVKDATALTQEDWEYNTDFFDGKIVLMQEPEKCINHCCNPNSYVRTINKVRKLLAIKQIPEGEEITCDYSLNSDNEGTFPCRCGAERCRKVYVGNYFKLPREIQIEYLPYLEGWFINLHQGEIDALQKSCIQ